MHLLEKNAGKLCLILPSGPLLYNNSSAYFRKGLFSEYNIVQIIDYTFLRRVLFPATVASLAIFIEHRKPSEFPIIHIIAKRTKQSKERFYFEFDHYDFHRVPKNLSVDKINVWKCNLLGGSRVCDIIDKFKKIKHKLKDWLSENNIEACGTALKSDLFQGEEMRKEISLFNDEVSIPKKQINYWGIKKNITRGVFPTEILATDFSKDNFDGIEFKGQEKKLNVLKNYLHDNSALIAFYIASISGRQGVRSPYVFELPDLLEFPYISNLDNNISESDKIVIDDIVRYSLEEFGQGEKAMINNSVADKQDLINFSQVYCDNLNKYYSFENKCYKLISLQWGDAYYICEIKHTDEIISQIPFDYQRQSLSELLLGWNPSRSAKVNKIIRYYDNVNNIIRIIKPKQLRFWLRSKALRDADDTFNDILTF
jgi:hypothetical protein